MRPISAQDKLREVGVRITMPRIAIYNFLLENRIHPTCDKIYTELKPSFPNLSLASVYNVTDKLCEAGLVKCLVDIKGEKHYDSVTELHGHFFCDSCSRIIDVPCSESQFVDELPGASVSSIAVYIHGRCPSCN